MQKVCILYFSSKPRFEVLHWSCTTYSLINTIYFALRQRNVQNALFSLFPRPRQVIRLSHAAFRKSFCQWYEYNKITYLQCLKQILFIDSLTGVFILPLKPFTFLQEWTDIYSKTQNFEYNPMIVTTTGSHHREPYVLTTSIGWDYVEIRSYIACTGLMKTRRDTKLDTVTTKIARSLYRLSIKSINRKVKMTCEILNGLNELCPLFQGKWPEHAPVLGQQQYM